MIFLIPIFIAVCAFVFGGNQILAGASLLAGVIWSGGNVYLTRRNPKYVDDLSHPAHKVLGITLYLQWALAILACLTTLWE